MASYLIKHKDSCLSSQYLNNWIRSARP